MSEIDEKITLPAEEYIYYEQNGRTITVCTLRQKALHTIGLNSRHIGRRLYTRHGKRYYKPFRNYFFGKDRDLDTLVSAGYMDYEDERYRFNRAGLDWLGEQLGIVIKEDP